ncbi:MAG: hypothetical protein VCB25_11155 [Myxococcota bacterium]
MTQPERESMEVDILYVGAGPATLASAYHVMKQVEAHNEACEKTGEAAIEPPTILVIEKGRGRWRSSAFGRRNESAGDQGIDARLSRAGIPVRIRRQEGLFLALYA